MADNPRHNHPRSLSTSAVEDEIQREKVKKERSASNYKTPQRANSNRTPTSSNKRSVSAYNYEEYDGEYSTDDAAIFLSAKKLFGTNIQEETFDKFIQKRRHALESQRASISIYTSPLLVLSYFILYMYHQIRLALIYLVSRTDLLAGILATSGLLYFLGHVDGFHTAVFNAIKSAVWWYLYWVALGIASSVGLGTGLHTFVLFLGPHIVDVTLTAWECGHTNFAIRGEQAFVCRPSPPMELTFLRVFGNVAIESFFWGLGTAIGELPPYFISRAAALSGSRSEELAHIEMLMSKEPSKVTIKERVLYSMYQIMTKLGFWGIFLCASIPNPLFDLAGITCGHFLVPFATFFGATLLGKAVIKSSLQTMIVVVLFSPETLDSILNYVRPRFSLLARILDSMVGEQVATLRDPYKHGTAESAEASAASNPAQARGPSVVSLLWNTVVFLMLFYFLLSIIESLARAHLSRIHEEEIAALIKKTRSKIHLDSEESESDRDRSPLSSPRRALGPADLRMAARTPPPKLILGDKAKE